MINFRDFLKVAHALLKGTTEAEWRSAASRAYYAAFHVGRLLLHDLGFSVPRADQAHAYVWLRLANCGHPDVSRAGQNLSYLRSKRNRADYDAQVTMSHAEVSGYVQTAEEIIRAFDAARLEPTRTQITDAMKLYERNVLRQVTWRP
jgi:uncharacterized protein (UPF0332 family)